MERIEGEVSRREAPRLSIVVASPYSIRDIECFLENLEPENHDGEVEVIVAECSQDGTPDEIAARYPGVTFVLYPERLPLPVLWGDGIARSAGQVIAITDSTCIAGPDWVAVMLKAHQSPHQVIGGAVEAARLGKLLDWAAYFCEYGQFMRPLKGGPVNELPGNNISFKRSALNSGREFVRRGFWKTYWCRKLQAEGIALISEPSMVVRYRKTFSLLPFLIRRFHHGKCYAGMRVVEAGVLTRAGYATGSWLLPLLFLVRVTKAVLPKRRYLREFILSLPFIILAVVSWSIGEFCGYLAGPGESRTRIY